MPLPPIGTLQAADQIEQVPQPDRLNVGPQPGQMVAPRPIPGTGQIETGSGFSTDYTNQVLGAKSNKGDPGHLQMYSGEDVYNPRYSSVLPGEDSEEAFAKAQPWYNKWANATIKMGATAAGTFWNGITAIPDTIANLKNGVSGIYQTESGNTIDKWLKNLEDQFPNYYTKWEQAHPFVSAIPFSGGGANFWSDKFLKNLGFTAGAMAGAIAQDAVVGAVTEGLGDIPLIGGQIGRAALYLNKVFTGTDKVGELMQLGKSAGRAGQQLLDLQSLARAAAATKVTNGVRFAMNLYGAAASEAGFEARDGYNTVKQDLINDYTKKNGYAPIDKDLADIEKYATAGANVRFGVNLALLGLSDAIQFDAILKPFSAAKSGARSSIQRALEERIGEIRLKKGSVDEFERALPTNVAGRVWNAVKPSIPAFLAEGVYEEGGQYAAQIGTQNFYERKYLYDKGMDKSLYKGDDTTWDSRDNINNIIHSVGNGMGAEFGTQEGLENIFLGGLTGLFSSGVEHFKDRKENAQHRQVVLDLLNKQGVTGTLKSVYDTAVTANRITADMKQAAKSGNIFKYKNFQHEQFVNFITSGIRAGRFDLRMEQLDMLKDMDNQAFKQAFGLDKTTENTKTSGEYVEALKEKAAEIKKSYDLINDTFQNPYTFKNKANTDESQLENEKHQQFNNWKDELLYLTSITPDVNRRKSNIAKGIQNIDKFVNPGYVQRLTDRKYLTEYAKELKGQSKILDEGLSKDLSVNKKADRERMDLLNKHIAAIEKSLASPDATADTKLFEDLLNFQLNGETTETKIQIAKAFIPSLINSGVDMNRLDHYKASANEAFDKLSTQKGFDKYFNDIKAAQALSAAAQQQVQKKAVVTPPTPPVQGQPAPTPPPVPTPPPLISVKNKGGNGEERLFEVGKDYFLPIGPNGEMEKVTVIGRTQADGLSVIKADGKNYIIGNNFLFKEDNLGNDLDEGLDEATSPDDNPPPPSPSQGAPANKRGESKKDLAFGPIATTDPPYDIKTTPDNNFQRRHQNFLFNLGSSDPEVFNQDNKPRLRLIPVTAKTQELLGFPKGWISEGNIGKTYKAPALLTKKYNPNGQNETLSTDIDDSTAQLADARIEKILYSSKTWEEANSRIRQAGYFFNAGAEITTMSEFFEDKKAGRTSLTYGEFRKDTTKAIPGTSNADNSAIRAVYVVDNRSKPEDVEKQKKSIAKMISNDKDVSDVIKEMFKKSPDGGIDFIYDQYQAGGSTRDQIEKEMADDIITEVLAYKEGSGIFYVDGNGDKQDRIDGEIDPSKAIYTNFSTTDLQYGELGNLEDRYTNKENLDPGKVMDWWREKRKTLLDKENISGWPMYQFSVSRGIPNIKNQDVRNNVVDSKLIREEDLDKPVIEILTLGNVAINGALNGEGEGIAAHKTSVNMGDMGKQVLNYGGNLEYLDPRRLSPREANNIFELLKVLANRSATGKREIFQYLNKLIYLPNANKGGVSTDSSLMISGANLFLGKAKDPILMDQGQLDANKDKIIEYLQTAFHNINNTELLKIAKNPKANDLQFRELGVKDGKVEVINTWKNYNHYLLSGKYPEGGKRSDTPLTTKIVVPQEGEVPIIQKYSVLAGVDFDSKLYQKAQVSQGPVNDATKTRLKELGWSDEKIAAMKPKIAEALAKGNMTPEALKAQIEEANKEQGVEEEKEKEIPKVVEEIKIEKEVPEEDTLSQEKAHLNDVLDKATSIQAINLVYREIGLSNPGISGKQGIDAAREAIKNWDGKNSRFKVKEEEGVKEGPAYEYIKLADVTLAFTNVVRDANGNITDLTAVGSVRGDGSIQPTPAPDALKAFVLKQLAKSQIKQDESNTPPAERKSLRDRLGNKDREKGTDPQYRTADLREGTYQKANLTKEFAEFQKMLPGVSIHTLDNMLNTTGGGKAWGALENGMVYIYKNAEVGTTYHEAFEAVWGHFLNGREQQSLYDEFGQREGSFMTYTGVTKLFSNASVKEAKEQLAEEFRDFKQEKRSPKNAIERFFQRVIDFIRRFIFGDNSLKNRVFKAINRGEYRNYATSLRSLDSAEYSRPGIENISESLIQDAIQGMTVDMFMDLFKENSDIIVQMEEHPERAAKTIYEKLLNNFTHYFESEDSTAGDTLEGEFAGDGGDKWRNMSSEEQDIALNQIDKIREEWGKIKGNWSNFVKEHKRYLKVFNVEFTIDDEGDIAFADEDFDPNEEGKNQVQFDRDIFSIDVKNAASPKVRLLIATIAESVWGGVTEATLDAIRGNETRIRRDQSALLLPKQVQYAKVFNYLLHNMSNINGIYDMWDKMKSLVSDPEKRKAIDANVQRMMNRLNFDQGFKDKDMNQAKLILALENTLSKQKPAFFRQFVDNTRQTYFKTSVLNSKLDQVKNLWTAGMRASDVVTVTGGDNFLFSHSIEDINDPIQFLNKIGIPIEKKDYERLKGKDKNRFNAAANKIMAIIKKAAKAEIFIAVLSPRELDYNSRIDELAELYISNITGDDSQSQHPNLENEPTSNFVLQNFLSTVMSDANNSETREEFINKLDNQYFKDIFHQDSILLNKILFDEKGNKTDSVVEIGVVEGRQSWNGDNKAASKLTEVERQLYEINNNLNGVFYTLLPADAKTEWAIYTGTYLSPGSFFSSDIGRRDEITKFSSQMYKWLQTEVNLAKDYKNRTNIDALDRKMGDRKIGNSLRFFADILDKDTVDKIHKQVVDGETPLNQVYTEPELRAKLIEYVAEKAESSIKNMVDWNLIDYNKDEDHFKLNGFDRVFLDTHLENKTAYTGSEVRRLLSFREMNYVMNNIEMHKFFFGDPGQYKDELKRVKSFLSGRESTHVDTLGTDEGFNQMADTTLNKAGKIRLEPTDPGYHQFRNHFATLTIRDVFYSSAEIDEIRKVLKDRADPYDKGNEADAQAQMMATAYREALYKAGGRFTSAQESHFQWEMAWERNDKAKEGLYEYTNKELEKADKETLKTPENTEVYFPILKLVHSGIQYENGVAIASLDKASWAPLFYRWYKGTIIGKLYNDLQSRGVDYVRMESAHKVGIQKDSTISLYNEKGEYNTGAVESAMGEFISLKHLGIQVEQAKKEKGQTEGSQARKIAVSDLMSNTVPIDFLKGKDEDLAFVEWNNMEEKEKLEASPIYQKINRHDTVLKRLTETRTDQTMKRLGIENKNGTWGIDDKKKISQFILDELERRELPRNIAYGLDVIFEPKTGKSNFVQPLEANAQYTKIRSIIYSVMEKTIMRPKVSGGQKTMLSVTGFEKKARIVKREVNGKPVFVSDTLKFYTRGEDGTQACEVMLPYWFGKQMMAMGSKRTKEEVLKYLNTTEEGKKLLTGIGFRIPTQGLNSIDFFTIKDFLPEQMGDVIVLPSEITAKAGSDFDIDKLNTYLRNFYVDNTTGMPKVVKWKGSPEKTREYIQKLLDEGNIISSDDRKELDRFIEEEKDIANNLNMDDLIMRIPGVANMFSEEQITRDFLEKGNYGKVLMDKVYMQALENEYFDSIEDLLKLPENYGRLISPNDASQMKEDRDYIKGLISQREGEGESKLGNYGKLLDSNFMMKERHAYLMSKGVVGTSAVSQTAHSIAQQVGMVVTDHSIVARFPHNTISGDISLSGLTINGSDQLISNVNSQTTDGGVDVAKDKFLAEMGINSDTLGTYLAIRRMGAPRKWAELFINQPAIQYYLKQKAINDSVTQVNTNLVKLAPYELNEKVYNRYGGLEFDKKRIQNKPARYTLKEMEEMITSKELTHDQQTRQLMMLDDYQKYNSLGWDLFHYYQGYNWDTARLNDPNEIRLKLLKYNKAQNLSVSPANKVMINTFIGGMKNATLDLDAGLRSLINVQVGAAGSILNDIAEDIFKQGGLTQYDRNQIMLAAEISMVDFAVQTNAQIKGKPLGSYIHAILLGDKNVARYVDAMQHSVDKKVANNPFVQNLLANLDKRKGWPSTIQLKERDYDTYTSNVWTDAFRELKEDHGSIISINDNPDDDKTVAQIYKSIVLAAIIQSGSRKTSTSLSHLVPNESYSEFTRDALRNMRLPGFYENNVLYRTNWNNDKLVPTVQPTWDELDPMYYWYPMFTGNDRKVINSLKDLLGGKDPAGIMNVPEWKYKNNKVIKIKETRNLATGEKYAVPLVRLFEKVSIMESEGPVPLKVQIGKKLSKNIFFKEINAWGDGTNIQEYHEGTNESVLPNNRKVNEITNDQLIYALQQSGYIMNIADQTIDQAISNIRPDDQGPDIDDETDNEEPPKDPNTPVVDNATEPEENIEECNPKFTIKNQNNG